MTCGYVHCENSMEGRRSDAIYCGRYCKTAARQHDCSSWRSSCNPSIGVQGALERNREFIRSAKEKPCADCGVSYPHYVMDFDHLPGFEKRFELSKGKAYSLERIKAEIAKCDLVCSNCHRIRTWNRREVDLDK